jgi:hypothetical protein
VKHRKSYFLSKFMGLPNSHALKRGTSEGITYPAREVLFAFVPIQSFVSLAAYSSFLTSKSWSCWLHPTCLGISYCSSISPFLFFDCRLMLSLPCSLSTRLSFIHIQRVDHVVEVFKHSREIDGVRRKTQPWRMHRLMSNILCVTSPYGIQYGKEG